jgi:RecA-family ATPase
MAPLKAIIARSDPGQPFKPIAANDNKADDSIDAQSLMAMEFAPVDYVVDGYVAEGLTILAGRPKLGKSWLALGMCVAVATGGQVLGVDCEQGDALYMALEDNRRRLQDRLGVVLYPEHSRPDVSRLTVRTIAPMIGAGLLEELDKWRTAAKSPKLIVIDTLAKVRPAKKGNQDSYSADYEAIAPLQRYASEHRLAVIVVHHVRKAEAEDPLEAVSGTNGLTGAADTIMVLNRNHEGAKLYGRGRDIEEIEKAIRFDKGRWEVLGDADDVKRSDQRRKVLATLKGSASPMKPDEIARETGMIVGSVNQQLRALVKSGDAEKIGYGQYLAIVQ